MSWFVDSSAWYAVADSTDRSNAAVKRAMSESTEGFVTTDHVLVETWLLLRHRIGRRAAERFWEALVGGVAHVAFITDTDLHVAREVGEKFDDQDFSIVDRTSFAVMLRLGIEKAVTLDADFAVFRFGRKRDRAFRIAP